MNGSGKAKVPGDCMKGICKVDRGSLRVKSSTAVTDTDDPQVAEIGFVYIRGR